ncbi:glycosyltransferase [Oceanisphaera sp. IT1-181]|uniref:glycosyltransferase family 4 protein n=1 Tax=Oceanisphaera sp. IT1-181 TaxID=3081199 RepID=UPI0029C9B3F2|nr:glycosyltransferase [Oceanisphaera sp. IT1-181]
MSALLIVTEHYGLGGLETYINTQVEQLTAQGWQVHLACGERFSAEQAGERFASVTQGVNFLEDASLEQLVATVDGLQDLIKLHNISTVHAHPFTTLLPALLAAKLQRLPMLATLHGPASITGFYGPVYNYILTGLIARFADRCLVVSPEVQQLAKAVCGEHGLQLHPNGIAVPHAHLRVNSNLAVEQDINDDAERNHAEAPLNSSADVLNNTWLVVSRLDADKAPAIVGFVAYAEQAGIDSVHIAGEGDHQDWLAKQLGDKAKFLGACHQVSELMPRYTGIAGMGRVVLEAVAAGRPICLLGYDGVKGILTEAQWQQAALANFSGRNLPIISAAEFVTQLASLAALPTSLLAEHDADMLWHNFAEQMAELGQENCEFIDDFYHELKAELTLRGRGELAYLHTHVLLDVAGRLWSSPQYYHPQAAASYDFYAQLQRQQQLAGRQLELQQGLQELQDYQHQLWLQQQQSLLEYFHNLQSQITEQEQTRQRQVEYQQQNLFEYFHNLQSQITEQEQARQQQVEYQQQSLFEYFQNLQRQYQELYQQNRLLQQQQQSAQQQQVELRQQLNVEVTHLLAGSVEQVSQNMKVELDQHSWFKRLLLEVARLPSNMVSFVRLFIQSPSKAVYKSAKYVYWRLPAELRERLIGQKHRFLRHFGKIPAQAVPDALNTEDLSWEQFSQQVLAKRDQFKGVFVQEIVIDWDVPLYQRPQHIACAFGRIGYLVIYKTLNFSHDNVNGFREVSKNVWLSNAQEVNDIPSVVRSFYSTAYSIPPELIKKIDPTSKIMYEYIDHIDPAISGDDENIRRLMSLKDFAFSGGADVVVASAKKLEEEAIAAVGANNVILAQNGVDTVHYRNPSHAQVVLPESLVEFRSKYTNIVGYFGALAPWLWYDVVNELIASRPDLGFVFIGPDYYGGADQLNRPENVLYLGTVDYKVLPAYARQFDVCFIPFAPIEIARTTSPLKLFEYFALEKPVVVSSEMRECVVYDEVFHADSVAGFSACIDQAIAVKDNAEFKRRMATLADSNGWDSRAEAMAVVFDKMNKVEQ